MQVYRMMELAVVGGWPDGDSDVSPALLAPAKCLVILALQSGRGLEIRPNSMAETSSNAKNTLGC